MSRKKQNDADVSRRDFLKKGAIAGVGASALAGLGLPVTIPCLHFAKKYHKEMK